MSTLIEHRPRARPLRSMWRGAHHAVPDAPGWARKAAYLVPLCVLPSSVWRIVVVVGARTDNVAGQSDDLPAWLPIEVYVVLLSVVSELLAFTAVGLVASWGEVFPRWLPQLRRRSVPTLLAAVPATIGATVLTALTLTSLVTSLHGTNVRGEPLPENYPLHLRDLEGVVSVAAYAPLLLWGPLLAALTVAYVRRRRRPGRRNPTRRQR